MNRITVSRFIHLSHISASFFFVGEYYPIVWLDHLLCIRHQLAACLEKETLGLCDELPPQLAQDHFPKPQITLWNVQ